MGFSGNIDRNRELIEKYAVGESTTALGKNFNLSRQQIRRILCKSGIKIRPQTECQRKYTIDETFFYLFGKKI